MSKTIENLKSGNYEVVDNRGVSVTIHFVECLEKEFADLEAKLALYDEVIKEREDDLKTSFLIRDSLEQQLAEKEKEIENVTIRHLDMLKYFIRHNSKQGIILSSDLEREIKEIEQGEKIWQTKNFNQDKISFCIEQLEKVKYETRHLAGLTREETFFVHYEAFRIFIDNQIEELKKEMK